MIGRCRSSYDPGATCAAAIGGNADTPRVVVVVLGIRTWYGGDRTVVETPQFHSRPCLRLYDLQCGLRYHSKEAMVHRLGNSVIG